MSRDRNEMQWTEEQHQQSAAGRSLDKRFLTRDMVRPARPRPPLKPCAATREPLPLPRIGGTVLW